MAREKILVVDEDLYSLSKTYLALIHRKFKAEACNNVEEIMARLRRFKPTVIILGSKEYEKINVKLKIPAIVISDPENINMQLSFGDIELKKPVSAELLIQTVEKLI